jgi:hypothetical protein
MTDLAAKTDERLQVRNRMPERLTYCLWGVACVFALWGWISPHPYRPIVLANVVLPLVGIPLVFWSQGRVAVVFMGKDEPAQIALPFLFCGLILCLRGLDRPILGSSTALVYAAVLAVPFAILAWWFSDEYGKVINTGVGFLIGLVFAGGAIVCLDRVLDASVPEQQYIRIESKYVSGSRSRAYTLSVFTQWAPHSPVGFAVNPNLYARVSVGDTAILREHAGAFHLPWFDLGGLLVPTAGR